MEKKVNRRKKTYNEYSEKSSTLVGVQSRILIDKETGEEISASQIIKRTYGYKPFMKVFLLEFLKIMDIFESKQLDVLLYMLDNINPFDNTFIGTYDKIQKDLDVSRPTISSVLRKLQTCMIGDLPAITKIQNGVWRINPNLIMKGNDSKRNILLSIQREEYEEKQPPKKEQKSLTPPPLPSLFPSEVNEEFSECPF